ncbi:MAG TPA: GNAT family N-acetyltransferase [Tetragenococcus sp.]|nr:GNAT family N-acetyltransferase [Tetragenococcus sp.]
MSKELILAQNTHLASTRLWLRPVNWQDVNDMFEYANDAQTTYFVFETHDTINETQNSIANYFMAEPLGKYAIELKKSGKMIGTIDLRINEETAVGELGYTLNRAYWGQGITCEAARTLIDLAFTELGLVRVMAVYDQLNPNSGKVMEKLGMQVDSVIKDARMFKGRLITEVRRSITKTQWENKKGQFWAD